MAARFEGLSDLEWRLFEDIFPPKPCGKFFSSLVPYPLRTKNLKIFRFPLDKLVCPKYLYFMSLQNLSSDSSTKILQTASRLFYEQGYHVTGINQVITEAGVSKASFYHHFSSKEKLCIAYLHKRHQNWFSWLQQEVELYEDHQERLLSLFTFLERWLPDSNFRGCAFLNIASEFPLPESKIRLLVVDHKNALQDYIRQLVDRLNISTKKNNTVMLADFIYVLFEGAITESQIHRSTRAIQAAREAVKRLIS